MSIINDPLSPNLVTPEMVASIKISKICDAQIPFNPCNHAKCVITLRDGRQQTIKEVGQFDTTILIEGVKNYAKIDAWAFKHFSFEQYPRVSSIMRKSVKLQAQNYLSELFQ